MQRCFLALSSGSDVRTVLEKQRHHLHVALLAGTVQRRFPLYRSCSDVITVLEKQRHHLRVAL